MTFVKRMELTMSKKIIDSQTYIELADDIANGVMEELFCHLLPNLDEEEWLIE